MKSLIGLMAAFLLGAGCRFFDIPVPSPPRMVGSASGSRGHRGLHHSRSPG